MAAGPPVVALDVGMLDDLLALSGAANWNQTSADWQMMLAAGRGWGIREDPADPTSRIIASTLVLPRPPALAWVSMVLVLPQHRRRGLASLLMRLALATLDGQGLPAWLDATADGRAVYRRLGFEDQWSFTRWQRACSADARSMPAASPADPPIVALTPEGLAAADALDREACGAARPALIEALLRGAPQLARQFEPATGLSGFIVGRVGRIATQRGPLLACDPGSALALLRATLATLAGPVFIDVPDHEAAMGEAVRRLGFEPQRGFMRMRRPCADPVAASRHGDARAAAGRPTAFLLAGPELG